MIPLDDFEEQIVSYYNPQMRCKGFRRALQKYDMDDAFLILQFLDNADADAIQYNLQLEH